jgi:hypothetical protein
LNALPRKCVYRSVAQQWTSAPAPLFPAYSHHVTIFYLQLFMGIKICMAQILLNKQGLFLTQGYTLNILRNFKDVVEQIYSDFLCCGNSSARPYFVSLPRIFLLGLCPLETIGPVRYLEIVKQLVTVYYNGTAHNFSGRSV